MSKFGITKNESKGYKIELHRLEKNFELYRSSDNKIGLYFVDEVDHGYDSWSNQFTEEEVRKAAQKLRSLLYGKVAHLPIICKGWQTCVYGHVCPFKPNVPVGRQCPYESAYVIEKLNSYREELVVDSFKETHYTLVSRLIELELFDMRLSAMISKEAYQNPVYEQVIGTNGDGDPVYSEQPNPMYEMKEKLSREKMKLLNVLVETPEAQYKKQVALKEVSESKYDQTLMKLENLILDAEKKLIEGMSEKENEE